MVDELSLLSKLSSNSPIKSQIISNKHTHSKNTSTTYDRPPSTKPQHLLVVSAANLMLIEIIVCFVLIFMHDVINDESELSLLVSNKWNQNCFMQ